MNAFQIWGVSSFLNTVTEQGEQTLWCECLRGCDASLRPVFSFRRFEDILHGGTAFSDGQKTVCRNYVAHVGGCCHWRSGLLVVSRPPPQSVRFTILGLHRTAIEEEQKPGHTCFKKPSVCMCETQATSTIYALQTATSFRRMFKGKVTSSHYTVCTHYAVLYIDPSLVCRMCSSLYIN